MWSGGDHGDTLGMNVFHPIHISLCEGFIHCWVQEIIWAICSIVVLEEVTTFNAAFVLIQEFVLGVK